MKPASDPSSSSSRSDTAKYRGVRKRKWGKWVSEIRLPNSRERIWLGSYDSPEKAARAFDAALFCLRGNTANFNFPDQPPDIPGGTDLHPSQIQSVAAHFANSHLPASQNHSDDRVSDDVHVQSSRSQFSYNDVMAEDVNDHVNSYIIPDYGIFPGFDDYFMPIDHQPASMSPAADVQYYGEEVVYDGVYTQEPSYHLWNF